MQEANQINEDQNRIQEKDADKSSYTPNKACAAQDFIALSLTRFLTIDSTQTTSMHLEERREYDEGD